MIDTPGSGWPIEPVFGTGEASVVVSTGPVSVSPYPSKTTCPVAARKRPEAVASSGAAPDTATRTVANASPQSGSSDQATIICGTATTTVIWCRAIRFIDSAGSKRSSSTPVAPCQATAPRPELRP